MKYISFLFILGLAFSCRETGSKENELFQRVIPVSVDERISYETINKTIIEPFGCITCHANWAGTEEGLRSRFTPGDPFSSPLYIEIENGSMPLAGPSVDRTRLEFLERFIRDY